MKKNLLLLIVVILIANVAHTQSKTYKFQKSDIEIGLGKAFAPNHTSIYDDYNTNGAHIRLEYRRNFEKIPLDMGFQIAQSMFNSDMVLNSHAVATLLLVANYHFYKRPNISLYSGVGVGYVSLGNNGFGKSLRVGAKMLKHINLSLEYKFLHRDDSHAVLALGYYF